MDTFSQSLKDKLAYLFQRFAVLPTFLDVENRARYTFVATPREAETFERLKGTLSSLKSGLEITKAKSYKDGHQFEMGDKKIVILYTKKEDSFDFFCDVSAYGLNSLLGKIAKGSGLKLTQEGLYYEARLSDENHHSKLGHVLITRDTKELMDILELDYEEYKKGFNIQDDMFAFVAKTPYMKSSVFTTPVKEHKHPIYEQFQAYLIKEGIETPGANIDHQQIHDMFPNIDFLGEVEKLREKDRKKMALNKKFNGRVILDHFPDFDKKKLGTAMGYFKFSFDGVEAYQDYLIENDIETILGKFKETVQF